MIISPLSFAPCKVGCTSDSRQVCDRRTISCRDRKVATHSGRARRNSHPNEANVPAGSNWHAQSTFLDARSSKSTEEPKSQDITTKKNQFKKKYINCI